MLNKKIFLLIILLISLIIVCGDSIFASDQEFPFDKLVVANNEIGTAGHLIMSNVLEGISEKYPDAVIRSIPSGVEQARVYMVRTGQCDTAFGATFLSDTMREGTALYSSREWGPQPVRHLWISKSPGKGFAVRGDSDIYTFDDLRGKKVASFPTYPGSHLAMNAMLAFGGLTWDDVVPVEFGGHAESYRAVKDGRIDVTMFNTTAPAAYELESIHGIRYLEMPIDDTEGWARMLNYTKNYKPMIITTGAGGITKEKPIELAVEGAPTFWAYDFLDEDIAYWIVKAIHESKEYYVKRDPNFEEDWSIDVFMNFWDTDSTPMHDGAIKYLKEIGYWTPEREQMNKNRLAHEKELKSLWDSVVEEAELQNISYKAFPEFWMEKREEAGFYWLKNIGS